MYSSIGLINRDKMMRESTAYAWEVNSSPEVSRLVGEQNFLQWPVAVEQLTQLGRRKQEEASNLCSPRFTQFCILRRTVGSPTLENWNLVNPTKGTVLVLMCIRFVVEDH